MTLVLTAGNVLAAGDLPASPARAGLGALDFVFIAIAAYVVWRMLTGASKRGRRDDSNTYDVTPEDTRHPREDSMDRRARNAQAAWEHLTGVKPVQEASPEAPPALDAPGEFNEREFLRGAKMIYGRIRQSLAMRNLADLRQFCAPDIMREFEQFAADKPDREVLVVMLVEARVLKVTREESRTLVDVSYEATISDDPKTNSTRKAEEVWRFSRDESMKDANWLLERVETTQ